MPAPLRSIERRTPREHELDAELAFHLEMQVRRYIAAGLDPQSARAEALRRLGNVDDVRQECRAITQGLETHMRRTAWWQGIRQDIVYAGRVLRRAPVFTATTVLTIAIGIGASTAIFSVVNDVLLRSLPYSGADRVVLIWNSYAPTGLTQASVAAAEFADIREAHGAFESVAAVSRQTLSLVAACGGGAACEPENVNGYAVSANLFDLLRVSPQLGRPFAQTDGLTGAAPVVLLSDALWHRRFGADRSILGRSIELGGQPRTVIGVMPASVRFPDAPLGFLRERADLWVPFNWEQRRGDNRGNQNLAVVARVRDGLPVARAQTDLNTIADQFRAQFPRRYAGPDKHWRLVAISLRTQMVGDVRPALVALLGVVGLLLLIACANVAHLMLARGVARRRELAVRSALGAGRARLVRQLVIEAALLTAAGGGAGVLLAVLGLRVMLQLDPTGLPRLDGPTLDGFVLAFSVGATTVTGVLLGLAPALRHSRVDPQAALGDGARGTDASPLRRSLRSFLVVAEVALAMVVLVGAGLLVRSFAKLERVQPGFDPSATAVFKVALPRARYDTAARQVGFFQDLAQKLAVLPGATQASGVYPLPMSGDGWSGSFFVEGQPVPTGQREPHAEYAVALPAYFKTLRIPFLAGRDFTALDDEKAPPVVVVDDVLARRYWPGQAAVGKRLSTDSVSGPWATVVGVVGHVHNAGPQEEGEPQLYLPVPQQMATMLYFAVHSAGAPESLLPETRGAVNAIDAKLPIAKLTLMTDIVDRAVARQRFNMLLFAIFGGVALALAAVGLYGVMAFLITQRVREIGIRLALGGQPGRVLRQMIGEGMAMAIVGVGLGLALALALSQAVAGLLFATEPTDPITYGAIAALLVTVALVASYLPARRALHIDPVDVLRA
jgi:putative ABC transport system permease protein